MRDIEREQITESTDAQLRDRLAALRERYENPRLPEIFRGYPMAQLRELHLIVDEIRDRNEGAALGRAVESLPTNRHALESTDGNYLTPAGYQRGEAIWRS